MINQEKSINDSEKIIEKLSPLEIKIIPFLNLDFQQIQEKSGLDNTSILRALRFLENKEVLNLTIKTVRTIGLGVNGIHYKKNHLPERTLLLTLEKQNHLGLEDAKKLSGLSENEFKVSLGVLKSKALITLANGKISLSASKEELTKKSFEEQLIEKLPLQEDKLEPQQVFALENLKKRKEIIQIEEQQEISFTLTQLGKSLAGKSIQNDLIEEVNQEVIKNWTRGKKFRKYDLNAPVPRLTGGKKHFVQQSIEYARSIWLEMGFQEMKGPLVDTSFWVFDALFTPQDHPAREMQDTFFIDCPEGKLPDQKKVTEVKNSHQSGVNGSKGWNYNWQEKEAKKVVLRTHTTSLSVRTLSKLPLTNLPAKFFAIGKVFRNETVDWSHNFEFYQTEGIVVDPKGNLRQLIGYLKEFYKKMGFENIRFRPSFFAYTEPSLEIEAYHPEKKIWIELGGAGIFRPEVTMPLLGKPIPVLAWGQGFDRIIMDYHKIKDLREMYANDLQILREKRFWIK